MPSDQNAAVILHGELDAIGGQCQKDCGEFISWLCTLGVEGEMGEGRAAGQLGLRANGGGGGGAL